MCLPILTSYFQSPWHCASQALPLLGASVWLLSLLHLFFLPSPLWPPSPLTEWQSDFVPCFLSHGIQSRGSSTSSIFLPFRISGVFSQTRTAVSLNANNLNVFWHVLTYSYLISQSHDSCFYQLSSLPFQPTSLKATAWIFSSGAVWTWTQYPTLPTTYPSSSVLTR